MIITLCISIKKNIHIFLPRRPGYVGYSVLYAVIASHNEIRTENKHFSEMADE